MQLWASIFNRNVNEHFFFHFGKIQFKNKNLNYHLQIMLSMPKSMLARKQSFLTKFLFNKKFIHFSPDQFKLSIWKFSYLLIEMINQQSFTYFFTLSAENCSLTSFCLYQFICFLYRFLIFIKDRKVWKYA